MKTMQQAMGKTAMQRAIETRDFNAVVAVSPENVRYIGDVNVSTQASIRDRLALIVWAKGRSPMARRCFCRTSSTMKRFWLFRRITHFAHGVYLFYNHHDKKSQRKLKP